MDSNRMHAHYYARQHDVEHVRGILLGISMAMHSLLPVAPETARSPGQH